MLRFNRFYLIFSLVFSLLVPIFTLPSFFIPSPDSNSLNITGIRNSYYQIQVLSSQPSWLADMKLVILIVYFSVTLLLLTRFIINILKLKLSEDKNPSLRTEGHRIVLIKDLILPYSFFSTVFVNEREYSEGIIPKELLSHEYAHINQHHSLDIMFVELLRVIFWFNPVFIFYRRAIMLNHEYLADYAVAGSASNNRSYLNILVNIVFRKNNSYLASSFNYSFTKKRLLMITKTKLSKMAILKRMVTIPLFIIVGLLVLDAQETKTVSSNAPPPPPPPPPVENNAWLKPILEQHNITSDQSNIWIKGSLYFSGDQLIKDNNLVTLKEAVIICPSIDKMYRIIKAKSAIYDLTGSTIQCEEAKVETYKQDEQGSASLIDSKNYKDISFKLVDEIIAPPPPPPPPPVK
jgi:hypothetical protein